MSRHRTDRTKYYLRIPVPGYHGEFRFVEVDPADLDTSIVRQLWTLDHHSGREANSQYRPAIGAEALVGDTVTTAPLLACVEEARSRAREALEEFGDAGAIVQGTLVDPLDFESLLTSLASGQVAAAEYALRDILHVILAASRTIAGVLRERAATADGLDVAVQVLDATVTAQGSITEKLYIEWATAADMLNRAVAALAREEATLRAMLDTVNGAAVEWQRLTSVEHPDVATAIESLETSENSFLLQAFTWQRDPIPREEMANVIAGAKAHIATCRERETAAITRWTAVRAQAMEIRDNACNPEHGIDVWLLRLEEATKDFRNAQDQLPSAAAKPFEVSAGELITHEEYERSAGHLRNPQWGPRTARSRLHGLATSIVSITEATTKPRLPDRVLNVIGYAEKAIEEIKAEVNPPAAPSLPPELADEDPGNAVPPSAVVGAPMDPRRAEELYELVIAVGFVLTCNHQHLAASTIRAMLEVVRYLGRCSAEEAEQYRAILLARSKEPGERETVFEGRHAHERWKRSAARWIAYRTGNNPMPKLKLTKTAGTAALPLRMKYGLSTNEIRQAHQKKRNDQRAVWEHARGSEQQ